MQIELSLAILNPTTLGTRLPCPNHPHLFQYWGKEILRAERKFLLLPEHQTGPFGEYTVHNADDNGHSTQRTVHSTQEYTTNSRQ